jgi:hypothetical protein
VAVDFRVLSYVLFADVDTLWYGGGELLPLSGGKPLKYVGINKLNRTHAYHSTAKRCRGCAQKPQCTRGKYRIVSIHVCEAARQKAYEIARTPHIQNFPRAVIIAKGSAYDELTIHIAIFVSPRPGRSSDKIIPIAA